MEQPIGYGSDDKIVHSYNFIKQGIVIMRYLAFTYVTVEFSIYL